MTGAAFLPERGLSNSRAWVPCVRAQKARERRRALGAINSGVFSSASPQRPQTSRRRRGKNTKQTRTIKQGSDHINLNCQPNYCCSHSNWLHRQRLFIRKIKQRNYGHTSVMTPPKQKHQTKRGRPIHGPIGKVRQNKIT